jgi:hypothetical protein
MSVWRLPAMKVCGRKQQEKLMTFGESLYLGLVIVAFVAFALTLAYHSHADRRSDPGE